MEIRNLEVQKEQLNSQLQESRSMSGLERERPGSSANMDSKGWKSAVVTRMYEGKLKDLEKELEKKVKKTALYMFNLGTCFSDWRI